MDPLSPSTSLTLLGQLRLPNPIDAWVRFEQLYTRLLRAWARRRFRDADADDLVQNVFVKLMTELPRYTRAADGTFRGWLRTVAENVFNDFCRRKATRPLPPADGLSGVGAPLDEFEETEYRRALLASGMAVIRNEFAEKTWLAFERTAVQNQSTEKVAAELAMSKGAVYVAKSRVLARLREVVTDDLLD